MKNRHLIPAVLLLWASAGLRAQTVADSLTQAVADSPVQVMDSLVLADEGKKKERKMLIRLDDVKSVKEA